MYQLNIVGKTPVIHQLTYDPSIIHTPSVLSHSPLALSHHTSVVTNIVPLRNFASGDDGSRRRHYLVSSYDKTCSIVAESQNLNAEKNNEEKNGEENATTTTTGPGQMEKIVQFRAHEEEVMACAEINGCSSNSTASSLFVTGGFDGSLKVWNSQKLLSAAAASENSTQEKSGILNEQPEQAFRMETEDLACFKMKVDQVNKRLFVLSADQYVRAFDMKNPSGALLTHKLQGHSDRVRDIHYNSQSSLLTSVGDDRRVQLWDLRNNKLAHTFLGTKQQTMCVTSCGNDKIVVGGVLGDIKVFDLRVISSSNSGNSSSSSSSATAALEMSGAHDKVISSLFTVNASTCASLGGSDGFVNLWNVNDGSCVALCKVGDVMLDGCAHKL